MFRKDFYVKIIRKKSSFNFIDNTPGNGPFHRRLKHNCGDTVQIVRPDGEIIYEKPVQSVANHPAAPEDGSWSLSTGTFTIRFFQPRGNFGTPVHGIGGGYDKCQPPNYIDPATFSIFPSKLRTLWHSDMTRGDNAERIRDSGCYSENCCISHLPDFDEANKILKVLLNVEPDDEAMFSIIEVDE